MAKDPRTQMTEYDHLAVEPFFYTPGINVGGKRTSVASAVRTPGSPNVRKALAVPVVSQAAIDEFRGGKPSPYTMRYLAKLYQHYGKGWDSFEDWMDAATLKAKPYSAMYPTME